MAGRRQVVVAVALLGLAGCSRTADAPPPAPATLHEHWAGCDVLGAFAGYRPLNDLPGKGGVPAGFSPATAVLCETTERPGRTAQADPVLVDLERRAAEIGPLLTYLARASRVSTHPDDLVCPAMAWLPPWLFLLDARGRWISLQPPTDECGFPLNEFTADEAAWSSLAYTDKVIRTRANR